MTRLEQLLAAQRAASAEVARITAATNDLDSKLRAQRDQLEAANEELAAANAAVILGECTPVKVAELAAKQTTIGDAAKLSLGTAKALLARRDAAIEVERKASLAVAHEAERLAYPEFDRITTEAFGHYRAFLAATAKRLQLGRTIASLYKAAGSSNCPLREDDVDTQTFAGQHGLHEGLVDLAQPAGLVQKSPTLRLALSGTASGLPVDELIALARSEATE